MATTNVLHAEPAPAPAPAEAVRRAAPELQDPALFINRELSWLEFNDRVLEEARDRRAPIYERLKFLAIVSSNLDEFFMVRVAGLKRQIQHGLTETPADGMAPAEQLTAISRRVHTMIAEQHRAWREELLPDLAGHGVLLVSPDQFAPDQKAAAKAHFARNVFPALTPLAIDPGHPFPHLRNKSLNIALLLRKEGRRRKVAGQQLPIAVVQVPAVLPRLVPLPSPSGRAFALLEEIIAAHAADLFPGYAVKHSAAFRVTRNWDLLIDEEESEDLLSTIKEELSAAAPPELAQPLIEALALEEPDVFRVTGPLQLPDLLELAETDPRPELRVEPLVPAVPARVQDAESLFQLVAKGDLLLHHPYESFEPVLRFVEEAADDPSVVAIKQTLYRTTVRAPTPPEAQRVEREKKTTGSFVRALCRAAENGKQVTVLVEIKARFDEENNIRWARQLEDSGVHVVYGLIGLKTHCKVALVVRREGHGIRRYAHLGTGNYNAQTARIYTDLSYFTAREEITEDVSALFNLLTGYAEPPQWKRLAVAPFDLKERTLHLIEREAERARRGEPARIVAKMNSLVDRETIRALYAASAAGVEVDLLVRGICCLRPGVPGVSDRIRVTSVVDRFLEHARIFAFGTGERAEVYLCSADWMPRNFHKRIEVMCPVEDPTLKARLLGEVLATCLRDNVKARQLQVDGSYARAAAAEPPVRSQEALLELARRASEPAREPVIRQVAVP